VEIREKGGLLSNTEVEFELDAKGGRLRRTKAARRRGAALGFGRRRR
jgi:hypothetical protein